MYVLGIFSAGWLSRDSHVNKINTVKLGLYVHGIVRTLGYCVLSVDHGHRQSDFLPFFVLDKTSFVWNLPFFISLEGT